jgi:hypothetical protein
MVWHIVVAPLVVVAPCQHVTHDPPKTCYRLVYHQKILVITEISAAHGYKNSASSNSDEVIHGPELIPQHSKKVKNYTK